MKLILLVIIRCAMARNAIIRIGTLRIRKMLVALYITIKIIDN